MCLVKRIKHQLKASLMPLRCKELHVFGIFLNLKESRNGLISALWSTFFSYRIVLLQASSFIFDVMFII